jgi:hypothetical protein
VNITAKVRKMLLAHDEIQAVRVKRNGEVHVRKLTREGPVFRPRWFLDGYIQMGGYSGYSGTMEPED